MATKKQLAANKRNAKKSTGPVTPTGRAIVSINAVKHGILSDKLILPSENEDDYQQLFDGLVSSINPTGTLEMSIVEKIAINLWKQRRLVQAETAEINLLNRPDQVAHQINDLPGYSIFNEVGAHEFEDLDQEYCAWMDTIISEIQHIKALLSG